MHFYNYVFNEEKFFSKLQTLIELNGYFFIDTNILLWLHRLNTDSQTLFLDKLEELGNDGRLYIPKWAITEYNDKCIKNNDDAFFPFKKQANLPHSQLKELQKYAYLFIDDTKLSSYSFEDKEEYLEKFQEVISSVEKVLKPIRKNNNFPDKETTHNLIKSRLAKFTVNSDIDQILTLINSNAEQRKIHRLPPGFEDSNKSENQYGDLIIWYEILKASKEISDKKNTEQPEPVIVFLTNDNKKDWVYKPQKIKPIIGNEKSNKEMVQARPELKSELNAKTSLSFFLINVKDMVQGLSNIDQTKFRPLALSLQVSLPQLVEPDPESISTYSESESIELAELPEEETLTPQEQTEEASEAIQETTDTEATLQIVLDASNEQLFGILLDGAIKDADPSVYISSQTRQSIIEDFRNYNWYTQTPAFAQALKELKAFSLEESTNDEIKEIINFAFLVGRNLYQTACGNCFYSQQAIDLSNSFLKSLDDNIRSLILFGAYCEIFINKDGKIRESIKNEYFPELMKAIVHLEYKNQIVHNTQRIFSSIGGEDGIIDYTSNENPIEITHNAHDINNQYEVIEQIKIFGHIITDTSDMDQTELYMHKAFNDPQSVLVNLTSDDENETSENVTTSSQLAKFISRRYAIDIKDILPVIGSHKYIVPENLIFTNYPFGS